MMTDVSDNPLLKVENLQVHFPVKRAGMFAEKSFLKAVDDISFEVARGQTLGIVGESGSGKTTTALAVARLVESKAGKVELDGEDFLALSTDELREGRRKIQFIFQDPYSSLNPRLRAKAVVREPLDSLTDKSELEKQEIIDQLFADVGLRKEQQDLFPHQFSGGQRQRIGIARALATRPELIICDEPVSALDVAVQAQILNLLRKLQTDYGLTYLFISHDLGVVQHMCDHVAVMYMGRIVEHADRLSLFNAPKHPYTKALLAAVPSVNRKNVEVNSQTLISGDPPDPVKLPSGCRFASRCPIAQSVCHETEPGLDVVDTHQKVACHFPQT